MNSREYDLVSIARRDLERLRDRLVTCLGLTWIPMDIAPFRINPSFTDQYQPKEREFWRIFETHQGAIRKYILSVTHADNPNHNNVLYEIVVRIAENAHHIQPTFGYPTIELLAFHDDAEKFAAFRMVVEQELSLAPTQSQLQADLLSDYLQSISEPDLRAATEGNMRCHEYDGAMRNACTLVESVLRFACVNAGAPQAQTQTADNLAVAAYNENTGCLTPPWPVATQANRGAQFLFQGFAAYIRNAYGHNAIVMGSDRTCVLPFLKGCEFFLAVIKNSTKR